MGSTGRWRRELVKGMDIQFERAGNGLGSVWFGAILIWFGLLCYNVFGSIGCSRSLQGMNRCRRSCVFSFVPRATYPDINFFKQSTHQCHAG